MMPEYAFVLGAARSGTTAMAELLNAHPHVCMGIERYKYFVGRGKRLSEQMFEKDRFFRFDPRETNILAEKRRWEGIYKAMSEKWQDAQVVGDKLAARVLPYVLRDLPDPLIIYMLRDINQVASSWNVRALKARGSWPGHNDYRAAVPKWNQANSTALRHMSALGRRMLIIEYEQFFSGGQVHIARLADLLGVSLHPSLVAAYEKATHHYRTGVAVKSPTVLDGQVEFIEQQADLPTYRQLIQVSREQFRAAAV